MSDNPNFFDDDSLTPDWMRGGFSDEESASDALPPAGAAPWDQHQGSPPPAPPRQTQAAPPWATFRGPAAPPPTAPGVRPPWGESAPPPAPGRLDDAIDWGSPGEPVPGGEELPRGMTQMLPWRAEAEPQQEPPRSPIRRIGAAGAEPPRPAQPSADDLAWLSGFGEAASYDTGADVPPGGEDDLGWLRADETAASPDASDLESLIFDSAPEPAAASNIDDLDALFGDEFGEPEPAAAPEPGPAEPSALDDFGALFDDEFPEPEEQPVTPAPAEQEEDMDWLDEDLGDLPVLAAQEPEPPQQVLPDWMRAAMDEEPEEVVEELAEPDEEEALPDWLAAADEPESPAEEPRPGPIRRIAPAAEEPPRSAIRRIAPTPAPEPEPELEPEEAADMETWLAHMESAGEPEELPDDMQGLSYEEWERQQVEREQEAQKTDEDRMLEEGPDWFTQIGGPAPSPAPSGAEPPSAKGPEFVPDWFLGLEEQKQEDAPDWFRQMDFSADALAAPLSAPPPTPPEPPAGEPSASSAPDWFTGAALPGFDDAEWAAAFGGPAEPPEEEKAPEPPPSAIRRIAPPEAAPAPEDELSFEDEFALPELDLEAGAEGEMAPGEMPDWMADTLQEAPAPIEDELPLPGTGMLTGFDEAPPEPGEVPDWLTAAQDARAAPGDVPFPDIDLDQTMPTESALDAALFGGPETEPADLDAWMAEFAPVEGEPGAMPRPVLSSAEEPPEDFVERFDPGEFEEPAQPTLAPVGDDAPDWLRELAGEEALPLPEDVFGAFPAAEEKTGEPAPSLFGAEEGLDWLGDISAEDVAREEDKSRTAPDMPPRPDESIPALAPGTLQTAPLDSRAIDQLLGLYEPQQTAAPEWEEPIPELDALFGGAEPETPAAPAEPEPLEIGGVADWDWMPPSEAAPGEQAADLEALFDEAALGVEGDLFPPVGEAEDQAAPLPAVPEAPPRFRPRKDEPEPAPQPQAMLPTQSMQPEWLAEMRPSDLPVTVKAGGAETSITQKQVIELPERLRAFHEKVLREASLFYQMAEKSPAASSGPLAGIAGALPAAELVLEGVSRPIEGLVITREQQERLERLEALLSAVAAEEEEVETARAAEGVEAFDLEGYQAGEEAAPAPAPRRARRRRRFKPDRVIVTLLLLFALIAPFATDKFHFASDPPALEGEQLAVATLVDSLSPGDYVLVAFEYGPTAAGELDPLAEAVLRDALAKGAVPLTLSTNPAGAFHAQAVFDPLVEDAALLAARGQEETALMPGEDYFLLRYLAGEAVGVRWLQTTSTDAQGNLKQHPAFKTDLRGDKTNLPIGSLDRDLALIIVIGEDSTATRIWAEQLDGARVPKVALITAAIEALTVPYIHPDAYLGYLAGARDTYSYNLARNTAHRAPYTMPDDVPVDLPDPEASRWHSMALGASIAAVLIAFGMTINMLRRLTRRRRR